MVFSFNPGKLYFLSVQKEQRMSKNCKLSPNVQCVDCRHIVQYCRSHIFNILLVNFYLIRPPHVKMLINLRSHRIFRCCWVESMLCLVINCIKRACSRKGFKKLCY